MGVKRKKKKRFESYKTFWERFLSECVIITENEPVIIITHTTAMYRSSSHRRKQMPYAAADFNKSGAE